MATTAYQPYQNPEEEPLHIKTFPIDFDGTLKTKILTTVELAGIVNSLFRPIFTDYEGCTFTFDQYSRLQLILFFREKGNAGEKQIKNLININTKANNQNNSLKDRIQAMNVRNRNRMFDLSEDTKEILSEFIHVPHQKKVNWNQITSEVVENGYGRYQVYVRVAGIDIVRILKKKYGGKDKVTGGYLDYNINVMRPVNQFYNGDNTNYLITVTQLNTKDIEDLFQKCGMIANQGSISMVKA